MIKHKLGFTVVELLVVIIAIAILAAVSIVAYSGVQNRANDSAVQSDLRNLARAVEVYRVQEEALPPNGSAVLAVTGAKLTKNAYGEGHNRSNLLYCRRLTDGKFAFFAQSKSGKVYRYENGALTRDSGGFAGSGELCWKAGIYGNSFWFYREGEWRV